MCDMCETAICAIFDALLADYFRDFPQTLRQPGNESARPKYVSMEFSGTARAAASEERFAEMIEAATGIGYTPGEFMNELARRSGYKDWVHRWATNRKVPNGFVRKIILTCAEEMIREHGASPMLTLKRAA